MSRIRLLALITGVGVLSACGPAATTDAPTTTAEQTVAFNPCDELSTDALRAAGLDPATKSTSINPPSGPATWRICRWEPSDGEPYMVGVGSTTHTQDEALDNSTVTGFADVQVGPRAGKTYHHANVPNPLRCYVSIPAATGMHNVILSWNASDRESAPQTPPCDLAVEVARELEPFLPE